MLEKGTGIGDLSASQGTVTGLGKTAGSLSTRDSSCGKLPFGKAY